MNNSHSILLDPKQETLPVIHVGDYEFAWTFQGFVAITNRSGKSKFYSVDALNQISNSTGMPLAIRNMAWEALDWIAEHKDEGVSK